jgi:FtsP/CotA-like multicopper oxidase with cupredoxin domain
VSNLPRIHFSRLLLIAAALLLMVGVAGCLPPLTSVPAVTETPPEPPPQQLPTPTQEPVLPPTPTEEPVAALLDPLSIPKFAEPLVIPPVMPPESQGDVTRYSIAVRQFEQQILPAGFPKTTVWGYGRLGDPLPGSGEPSTFNFPSFTIEARQNEKMQVNWVNQLVDDPDSANPHFLPHLLPVDQTVHWANPGPQGILDPTPYLGPVPIVTHVHGAHVADHSDGNPEAWYMPGASDMPAGYLTQGEHYASQGEAGPGGAIFEYTNDWRAATLWYHDHTLGMTRLNVYAGMAGFWLLRDDVEDSLNLPGPAPKLGDAPGTKYYEIPIAIQDRSFNADGSLYYPASREAFDGYAGPYMPDTPVSPIWNPEFFGNTMVVNGKTWPYLEVEPRLYRLRLLNGNNSRFLVLKFDEDLPFHQIGVEGGLLPDAPVVLQELLLGPAERADVIVDFSAFTPGDEIVLLNLGPDGPFAELPIPEDELADPETTGQVMQFRVVEGTDQGNAGVIPEKLPAIERLASELPERDLTLNEMMYKAGDEELPAEAIMGTAREGPREYFDPITENPMVGDTEIWRVVNLTPDSHPIHLHLVMFQVLDRIPFDNEAYKEAQKKYLDGGAVGDPPDPLQFATGEAEPRHSWETGWKDTVIANPGHITRIIANFDLGGLYVWHCHILEHEDNEMMRPFFVGPMP